MRIFVDGGAHLGDTFDWVDPKDYDKVILVEPSQMCWGWLERLGMTFYPYALSDEDGEAPFYASLRTDLGHSLLQDKGDEPMSAEPIGRVKTVDIARWLNEATEVDDRVTLKLDIEGMEYRVLDRLLASPVVVRIERFLVEWHPVAPPERREALIARMRSLGIAYEEWTH